MIGQEQVMKKAVEWAMSSGMVDHMVLVVAETERAQTEAVNELAEAIDGAEGIELEPVDKVDRMDELRELIEEVTPGGGGSAKRWYATHGVDIDAEPEQLLSYIDLPEDEWTAQIERWADAYRDGGDYEDVPDRDLAAHHVKSTFGAPSLDWFEREIVDADGSHIIREALVGRLTAVESSIRAAADAADS